METPILLAQAGGASARPFHTHHNALDQDLVMRIATELPLKKLVIGGLDRVYEIGRIFRNEGIDTRHNPEFTMIELYQAYSDYEGMAELFETLLAECAEAIGVAEDDVGRRQDRPEAAVSPPLPARGLEGPLRRADRRRPQGQGLRPRRPAGAGREARRATRARRRRAPRSSTASSRAKIEDLLQQPTFLFDHPTAITPLAKLKDPEHEPSSSASSASPPGQEYSNAYTELNDPQDQRDRLKEQAQQRGEGDQEADLLDEDFVEAMESGMPPMGGMGVGIDRLVMLLTGRDSIRDVILFPTLKHEAPK